MAAPGGAAQPKLTRRASLSGYISSTTPARDLPSIDGAKFMFDVHGKGNVRVIVEHRGSWRKIIRYKEDSLYKWGFLRRWRGTVFSHPFMWQQMFYLFVLALVIAVITYFSFEQSTPEESRRLAEQVDLTVISGLSTAMNTLLSFVVAMFVRKAVIIWWEMNNTYMYKIWSTVNRLSLRMAIYFPSMSRRDVEAKETVLRYGCLGIALFFKDAREIDTWTPQQQQEWGVNELNDLVEDGLLTLEEKALLSTNVASCARSQVVWVWIASLFTKWCLEGRLPDPAANQEKMLELCAEARDAIGNLLNQLNTQFPLPYTHTVTYMMKALFAVMALQCGTISGIAMRTKRYEWIATQGILLLVMPLFYQGLIMMKHQIWNPFGVQDINLSFEMIRTRLTNECRAMFEAGVSPPYVAGTSLNAARLPPQLIVRQLHPGMMMDEQGGGDSNAYGPDMYQGYNYDLPASSGSNGGGMPGMQHRTDSARTMNSDKDEVESVPGSEMTDWTSMPPDSSDALARVGVAPTDMKNATACSVCQASFTLMRRQHWCRNCVKPICSKCSTKPNGVRWCVPCATSLQQSESDQVLAR